MPSNKIRSKPKRRKKFKWKKRRSLRTDVSLPSHSATRHPSIPEAPEAASSSDDSDYVDEYYDRNPIGEVSTPEEDQHEAQQRAGFFIGERRTSEPAIEHTEMQPMVPAPPTEPTVPTGLQPTGETNNATAVLSPVKFILGSGCELDQGVKPSPSKSGVPCKPIDSASSHRHHKQYFSKDDLRLRRQKGSEVSLSRVDRVLTEVEESDHLPKSDLDEMASHRFADVKGIRRHKIQPKKNLALLTENLWRRRKSSLWKPEHQRHELFIEMDELKHGSNHGEMVWQEMARWIKFEEDYDEQADRWGRPHVASLSFHSLLELRRGIENGIMLFGMDAIDMHHLMENIVTNMDSHGMIKPDCKEQLLNVLLLDHKHVHNKQRKVLKRNEVCDNLQALESGATVISQTPSLTPAIKAKTPTQKTSMSLRLQLISKVTSDVGFTL